MFKWIWNRKGQNTAEYAILIGVIVAAAIAMQTYIKRGLQGRVRESVDFVENVTPAAGATVTFTGTQYEPYYRDSEFDVTSGSQKTATTIIGGGLTRDLDHEDVSRDGYEEAQLGRASNE